MCVDECVCELCLFVCVCVGAIGYVSYECVRYFEPSVSFDSQRDVLGLPESVFMLTDSLVVFDKVRVCVCV